VDASGVFPDAEPSYIAVNESSFPDVESGLMDFPNEEAYYAHETDVAI
jgi:hypothetical protein